MVVTIDDILDQLWSENTRLLKELVFANKCLNILDELKSELNLIYKKFETQLNTEDKFNQLRHQLNYICSQRHDKDFAEINRKTCYISDTNEAKNYINDTQVVVKSDLEDIQEVVDNNQGIDNHKDVTVVHTSTDTLITDSSSSSSSDQQSVKLLPPMKPQPSVSRDDLTIDDKCINNKVITSNDCFDSTTNSYICRLNNCNKSYKNLKIFLSHQKKCKPMKKIRNKKMIFDKNSGKYKCRYDGCDKKYCGKGSLRSHERIHHERDTTKWLNCQYTDCQFQCLSDHQMKVHLNGKHSDVKTFVCSNSGCSKAFKTSDNLQKHSLIHQNIVIRCDVDGCQRKFRHKYGLMRHMVEHSSEPILVCPVKGCIEKFFTDKERKRHLKLIHNKFMIRPLKRCDWPGCEYFGRRLAKHMEVHTGEKRYPCVWPQCDKRFRDLRKLNDHMNIHNNVKPYACRWPGCDYRCANNRNILIHMRQVHKTKASVQ
ncbi:zinc finger protein 260-like [Oppia nitens]|uniref:zinc finger protein 260-like n=1 Tax=Oppia nitens TaxID=1686743 RepID=UPI0023DB2308|nr:zinc finger protein 260-like [Oppia nitens]